MQQLKRYGRGLRDFKFVSETNVVRSITLRHRVSEEGVFSARFSTSCCATNKSWFHGRGFITVSLCAAVPQFGPEGVCLHLVQVRKVP